MKRLYKKSVLILCSLSFAGFVFAQNIELPEVTTVISGDTEKVEADALPDFSGIFALGAGEDQIHAAGGFHGVIRHI